MSLFTASYVLCIVEKLAHDITFDIYKLVFHAFCPHLWVTLIAIYKMFSNVRINVCMLYNLVILVFYSLFVYIIIFNAKITNEKSKILY